MKLSLENIRGFAGSHHVTLRPLTLVVGENSSGKTTLLAALSAALQPDFPAADVFNRAPFELGSFDTIATYRGGAYGRAPSFSIGWEVEGESPLQMNARFVSHHGIPRVAEIEVRGPDGRIAGSPTTGKWQLRVNRPDERPVLTEFSVSVNESKPFMLSDLPRLYVSASRSARRNNSDRRLHQILDSLWTIAHVASISRPSVTALAPLRTRPHRTYDELIEEYKPEGDHVPLVLARILAGQGQSDEEITDSLNTFGRSSGLFDKLKVKRMGKQPSDPFQLRVKGAGPDANLVDVGYGVSQALPIIVDSILAPKNRVVLIQQPEVHLHPRAQAALGTFFCEMAKDKTKRYVIETHSDYMLDRVRIAVAQGLISAEDVNIVFLERKKLDVRVHELRLDKQGSIVNAPASYRQFFLEEETRLLFRGK